MFYRKILSLLLAAMLLFSATVFAEETPAAWQEAVKHVPASAMPTNMSVSNIGMEFTFDDLGKNISYVVRLDSDSLRPLYVSMHNNGELSGGDNISLDDVEELFIQHFPDAEDIFVLPSGEAYLASAFDAQKQCLYSAQFEKAGGTMTSFEISFAYNVDVQAVVDSVFSVGAVPLSFFYLDGNINVKSFYAGDIANVMLSADNATVLEEPSLKQKAVANNPEGVKQPIVTPKPTLPKEDTKPHITESPIIITGTEDDDDDEDDDNDYDGDDDDDDDNDYDSDDDDDDDNDDDDD